MRQKFQSTASHYSASDRVDFWRNFLTYFGFFVAGHLMSAYGFALAIKALSLAILGGVIYAAPLLQGLAGRMADEGQSTLTQRESLRFIGAYILAPVASVIAGFTIG